MALDNLNSKWSTPGTDDGILIGRNADSKVGFYGTDPIGIQTLASSTATVADVITALAALGLVIDSDA